MKDCEEVIKKYQEINLKLGEIIQRLTNLAIVLNPDTMTEMQEIREEVKKLNEQKPDKLNLDGGNNV